jgi:DNA polymerase-3 subunit delta
MPKGASCALDALLDRDSPDPVYLLHGDNEFLKDEAVRAIVARFTDAGTRDFNLEVLHGSDADAGRLSTALDAMPMLARHRVVVLRDVSALKKDARTALDRYLGRPASDTLLILVAPVEWKVDAKLAAQTSMIDFPPLDPAAAAEWAIARAGELGALLSADAARLLARATGADLALIDGEIRKLRDYAGGATITVAAVEAVVGGSSGATPEDVIERVCARDSTGAAAMLDAALSQPKASGVTLVLALSANMVLIGHALAAKDRRMHPGQIAKELYSVMGEGRSSYLGRSWGDAVTSVNRNADRWDRASVDRALSLLAEADGRLKDATLSAEERILETLVLAMCAPARMGTPRPHAA